MAKILIVDDDDLYCKMLSEIVLRMGHEHEIANTIQDGLLKAEAGEFDLVFMDVYLPDGIGLDYIPRFQEVKSEPEIIIVTGLGDPDGAEMAVKSGAWDYVQKGTPLQSLTLPLVRALKYRKEKQGAKTTVRLKRDYILGGSAKIKFCLDLMAQGARSNTNVLITGETGTGKELFARAIHENSRRASHNFVIVDCAALPDTLVESVLFGYTKGAFTGADHSQEGLIAQADKGTLFLDEVGELPMTVQKSFLRVLQEHVFRPLGSGRENKSDFRLVAATNRNLEDLCQKGLFREDLLYRLQSFVIELPPLRDRPDDIKELAIHYMTKLCERNGTGTKGISPDFMEALLAYYWPGNVRELVNTIDRSLAAAQNEPTLYRKHLPPHIHIYVARSLVTEEPAKTSKEAPPAKVSAIDPETPKTANAFPTIREFRESMERQYIKDLLQISQNDIGFAVKISGMSKSRIYDLVKKYKLS